MPELISFGVAGILFILSWFALRASIQDAHKDAIFDVRDEVRRRVASLGKLDSPNYRGLRDNLNRYIRFVEVANFTRVWGFAFRISEDPNLEETLTKQINQDFAFEDADLSRLSRWARRKCCRVIQNYLFDSSLYCVIRIHLVCLPWFIGRSLIASMRHHAYRRFSASWLSAKQQVRCIEDERIPLERAELFSQATKYQPASKATELLAA